MRARKNCIQREGFTMIEVLVTLVILSLGLLGLAGLQISSLKMSQSAGARSVASQYAYAILDKIRSGGEDAHHYACGVFGTSSCTGLPSNVDNDIGIFLNQIRGETDAGTFGSLPNATVKVYRRSNANIPPDCRAETAGHIPTGAALNPADVFVVCIAWDRGRDSRLGIGDAPLDPVDQIVWSAGRLW
ncbi:MAG: type IV pilus modification protein PilV [Zoogloeaceae bacterium]|jgi:type IV pilus modification protein PilV|nr:type IV pilus modification protein PilV [Zoogloeaceae bacterium]